MAHSIIDRDRRIQNRNNVTFDAVKETSLDSAYDNLVAEMDRVLSRRSYITYNDDQSEMPSPISQQNLATKEIDTLQAFNNLKLLRRDIHKISREAAESSTEMNRCIGELNKAKASLGPRFSRNRI